MIYKKIGSKIPSLSSLLLAGFFSTANGCGCGNQNLNDSINPGGNQTNIVPPEGPLPINDLASAEDRCIAYFLKHVFHLDYLVTPPPTLSERDLQMKHKAGPHAVKVIEEFIKIVSSASYPEEFKEALLPLSKIDKGNSALKKRGRSILKLLNEIASVWTEIHNCYKDLSLVRGASSARQRLKNERLPILLEKLTPGSVSFVFKPDFKHTDEPNISFLSGPQLARFLSDTDANGVKRADNSGMIGGTYSTTHPHHVDRIMNAQPELPNSSPPVTAKILIKNNILDKACKENTKASAGHLTQRGSSLGVRPSNPCNLTKAESEQKLLKTHDARYGTGYIPYVARIQNDTLLYNFDSAKLEEYLISLSDPSDSFSLDKAKSSGLVTQINSGTFQSEPRPLIPCELTFGTLFFTLFRGDTDFDFLSVSKGNENFEIKGNNANYAKWAGKSQELFNQQLADHIQNTSDLRDIFFIPNIKDIKEDIFERLFRGSSEGDFLNKNADASNPIATGSALEAVCKVIFDHFNLSSRSNSTGSDRSEWFGDLEKIGNLDVDHVTQKSTLSFERFLYIKIAKKLAEWKADVAHSADANNRKTVLNLKENIKTLLGERAGSCILYYNEEGKLSNTTFSIFLHEKLEQLNVKLADKRNRAVSSFEDIDKMIPRSRSQQQSGERIFDIEKLGRAFKSIYSDIDTLVSEDFESFLSKQEPSTSDDFESVITEDNLTELDRIRAEYQTLLNAQKAHHQSPKGEES